MGSISVEKPVITGSERLQLVIAFSRMNLDKLRPGDWINLKYDLKTFLGCNPERHYRFPSTVGILATPLAHPLPDEYSEDDFRSLQKHARSMLQDATQETLPVGPGIEPGGYMMFLRDSYGKWGHILAQGTTHDMFLLTLFFLISQEPSGRLKRCPECDAAFYRIKKQKYCSRICTNKVSMRSWLAQKEAEPGAEAKEVSRNKRHERYVAAQHKKNPTAKLKIARRPRKQLPA
jgi:hypothetical protein